MRRFSLIALLAAGLLTPEALAAPRTVWLQATDGVGVRGDLYAVAGDEDKVAPVILLFHQAGSNRGEYATIAPRLQEMGFNALAIDQRSGGNRQGYENETVTKLGKSTDYLDALADLEAALAWKQEQGYRGKTLVWGSSYSAALVFLLAAKHPTIDALLAFSPGEYLGSRKDAVRRAASSVHAPVLVLAPAGEREQAASIVHALPEDDATLVVPERAVHGSSMLITDRNPGAGEIWPEVERFLKRTAGLSR